ncbi:Ig-like domain-containing protein [Comamonas sp. JC664]|uniref:Ig-like domain-containing protein n=1 Tax=Comamonas sp. JC664 TaxID=2801917 RepID=UPI00174D07C8|nr:Ig-like domain-containing protein [Comamonas sp. JC664]MBL0693765.1 Ig-like domain-containing protein [Comamonas sp. JC664]GHG74253.1 hypothetical protein GCM10012319_21910 [Comamonas sp. KCTC 72670]
MRLRALSPYLTLAPLITGCINVPDVVDAPPDAGDPTTPDGGATHHHVSLTTIDGATHVRGPVTLQASTNVSNPETVELLLGGERLATLQAPYTYTWDSTAYAEATHTFAARVTKNGSVVTSAERRLVVDRTRPTIVTQEPSPDETTVPSGQPIRVRISERIRGASLGGASVQLRLGGILVERIVELSDDETLLTITPTEAGALPHNFELALADTITDLAGNPLDVANGTWRWSVPSWLSVGPTTGISPVGAQAPHLHLPSGAAPLLAWKVLDGISVHRYQDETWSALGEVLKVGVDGVNVLAASPVVLTNNGTPVVSWTEEEWGGGNAYVRTWTGTSWQTVGAPVDGAGKPSLHFGTTPQPWLAAIQDGPDQGSTSVRLHQLNGAHWQGVGTPLRADTASTGQVNDLSLSAHGAVPYIAWSEFDVDANLNPINGRVHVWRRHANQWIPVGGTLKAHTTGTSASQSTMVMDGEGHPVVAWSESTPPGPDGTAARVYVSRWTGNEWAPLGNGLSATPGNTTADQPSLALGVDGEPLVSWRESDGTTNRAHVRRWNGTTWQTLHGTSGALPDATNVGSPQLQVDSDGIPWIATEARAPDGRQRIFVYRFNR